MDSWDQAKARCRLEAVQNRLAEALDKAGRPQGGAALLGVSKTFSAEAIAAFFQAGLRIFGESYLNEARPKMAQLQSLLGSDFSLLGWHFIGSLQKNKAKYVAREFQVLHSLDDQETAAELNKRRTPQSPPLEVFIQLNVSGEAAKGGLPPEGLEEFLADLQKSCPNLKPVGLMTMPPYDPDTEKSRPFFAALRELRDRICPQLTELSMGMTQDLEVAVAEGSTIVRVGTALFGPR